MKAICHDCKYLREVKASDACKEFYMSCGYDVKLPFILRPFITESQRFITRKLLEDTGTYQGLDKCETYEKN